MSTTTSKHTTYTHELFFFLYVATPISHVIIDLNIRLLVLHVYNGKNPGVCGLAVCLYVVSIHRIKTQCIVIYIFIAAT